MSFTGDLMVTTFLGFSDLFVTSNKVRFRGDCAPSELLLLLLPLDDRFGVVGRGEIGGRPRGDELVEAKRVLSGEFRLSSKAESAELIR